MGFYLYEYSMSNIFFCIVADVLREMVLDYQDECLQTIVPYLLECHHNFQESNMPGI